jgi:para-nitrobenzyl esterase
MKFAASMAIALAILGATTLAQAQTVAVTGGQVRGAMLEKGGAVFKGIPYAAPPVGELRWREPMPVKPWTGVRDATAFGAICAQRPLAPPTAPDNSSEDCLILNVWAPDWPITSPKPVMVWFHGGGNTFLGASSRPEFDGASLARHGVVLVSFNYRLGSFGFFSHPALTRESPNHASGNQGVLDQIAVLKWVRDNIVVFGGDPNNVTIFGESAGSLNVSVLMSSPLSNGLFRRVIGTSGTAFLFGDPLTLAQAERRGEMLAARWNAPAGASVQDLRTISASDILQAGVDAGTHLGPNQGVTIDGHVFPKKPIEVFAAGEEHRVAFLHGSNARERLGPLTQDLRKATEDAYGPLAGRAQALYVGAPEPQYGTPAEQWATDTMFRCPAVAQLAWHAAAGNPSYHFEFARVPPGRESVGAVHGSDVPYVFGTLSFGIGGGPLAVGAAPRVPANAVDRQVSDVMQRYWTNFAKTGDPNGAGLPVWPKFDPQSRAYIQFTDLGPVAKEGLRRPYCDLFIENVKRQMAR